MHGIFVLLFTQEAPPILPTVTSGRYHIKWTQLADLPAPLYCTYAVVQHHKIYVTAQSQVEDAIHQEYVYDINTDHGVSCHHQAITMVFLISSVES